MLSQLARCNIVTAFFDMLLTRLGVSVVTIQFVSAILVSFSRFANKFSFCCKHANAASALQCRAVFFNVLLTKLGVSVVAVKFVFAI